MNFILEDFNFVDSTNNSSPDYNNRTIAVTTIPPKPDDLFAFYHNFSDPLEGSLEDNQRICVVRYI